MTDRKALLDSNETPEDVATLYSWANLHGAKYRDFSASRAQTREKARQRVQDAIEAERRRAREEAEAQKNAEARQQPKRPSWPKPSASRKKRKRNSAMQAEQQAARAAHWQARSSPQWPVSPAQPTAYQHTAVSPGFLARTACSGLPAPPARAIRSPSPNGHTSGQPTLHTASRSCRHTRRPPAQPPSAQPVQPPPLLHVKSSIAGARIIICRFGIRGLRPRRARAGRASGMAFRDDRADAPAQPVVPPAPEDTLQASRDRLTSRWFALNGLFNGGTAPVESVPAAAAQRAPVLAVFSLAGGVGKTSLVATLGRAFRLAANGFCWSIPRLSACFRSSLAPAISVPECFGPSPRPAPAAMLPFK